MKRLLLYLSGFTALFGVLYAVEANRPPEFSWKPTFSSYDKQPFGAYVFDRMAAASLPQPYRTTPRSMHQLFHEDSLRGHNLLKVVAFDYLGDFYLSDDVKDLLNYISDGNHALIAVGHHERHLFDTLLLDMEPEWYGVTLTPALLQQDSTTIYCIADSAARTAYTVPRALCSRTFVRKKEMDAADSITLQQPHLPATVLAENEKGEAVLLKYTFGKGSLLLSSTPHLFTNYGVLDTLNSGLVWQALGYLQNQPLLRLDHSAANPVDESPLRYILRNRPLRWGLYVLLTALVLFFVFTAKRKQRPVPVMKPPVNNLQQFARSIAALYLQKNNNADLIQKKYIYWADRLKRTHGIDVVNEAHTPGFIARFAAKTNRPVEACAALFRQLDAITEHSHVPDDLLQDIITQINNIH